jgi:hypothetical protein
MQPSCSLQASCRTQVSHPTAGPDVPATCKALSSRAHAAQQTKHHKCLQHALQQQNPAQAQNAPESHKVRTNSRPGDACNMHLKTRTKPEVHNVQTKSRPRDACNMQSKTRTKPPKPPMRRKHTKYKPTAGLGVPATCSPRPEQHPKCALSTSAPYQQQAYGSLQQSAKTITHVL